MREQLEEREEEVDSLRRETVSLRKEREDIRARVEKCCHTSITLRKSKRQAEFVEQNMATATKHPPAQDTSNTSVRVEIFDQAYNLRGTNPEYILKLAEYVDGKMRAVADQTHTVDSSGSQFLPR